MIHLTDHEKELLNDLTVGQLNAVKSLVSQVSEASYRRGYQQSCFAYCGQDAANDLHEWRFDPPLSKDMVPPPAGMGWSYVGDDTDLMVFGDSWHRVDCEHNELDFLTTEKTA